MEKAFYHLHRAADADNAYAWYRLGLSLIHILREYIDSRGDVPAAIKKSNKNTAKNAGMTTGVYSQNE